MTAQQGRALLLKVDTTGTGDFASVAGLRSKTISFNAETIDITSADSSGAWRELLGGGLKTARLQGSGVFKDDSADETVRGLFFAGTIRAWQVIIPDFGIVEGAFQITALDYAGDHKGEATYSLALESAGVLTFTAA